MAAQQQQGWPGAANGHAQPADPLHMLMNNMEHLNDLVLGGNANLGVAPGAGNSAGNTEMRKPHHHHHQQTPQVEQVEQQQQQQQANPLPQLWPTPGQQQQQQQPAPQQQAGGWIMTEDVTGLAAERQAAEERALAAEARAVAAEAAVQAAEERAERMEKKAEQAVAKAMHDAATAAKRKKRESARSRWKGAGKVGLATGLLFGAAKDAGERSAAEAEKEAAERAAAEAGVASLSTDPEWIAPDEKLEALLKDLSRPIEPGDVDLHGVPPPLMPNVPRVGAGGGSLISMSLAASSLAPRDAELLSAYLASDAPPGLTSLNLSNNAIGAPGLRMLALALPPTIATLDLTRNHICTWFSGDDAGLDGLDFSLAGVHALGDAIPSSGLTALSLRHNELSPAGARVLATAISHAGCSLATLDMGWCALGSEGVGVLARSLPNAHALLDLDLAGNVSAEDGDEGGWVPLLAEALPRTHGLRTLNLSANRLGYTRIPSTLAKRQEQYLHGIGSGNRASGRGVAPGQLAPPDAGAGAGNENVPAVAVLAPAVALSSLLTLRMACNALDSKGVLALGRALCRSKLTLLDLSHRLSPGEGPIEGTEEHSRFNSTNASSSANGGTSPRERSGDNDSTLRLCRLYQGSCTGVALQLLNGLVCALPSVDAVNTSAALGLSHAQRWANATPEPMLHWVARRGWVDWTARLLSLRHSDLFVLDQDGLSVLEIATPEVSRLVQVSH